MLGFWPRKRRRKRRTGNRWDLSAPVLDWCAGTPWTIGDACQGLQVFGSTGSGKSTGAIATVCGAFLEAGFGGLFLTAKREDRATYERYAAEAGRRDDVLVFSPDNALRYNFINAELGGREGTTGLVENLTSLLMTVTDLLERQGPSGGRENDKYFRGMSERLTRNGILAQVLGRGGVTIPELHRFITSAPHSIEQADSPSWRRDSFCYQTLTLADKAAKSESQRQDFALAVPFFLREWPQLGGRTRGSIETTLTAATDLLSRGAARDLLSSPTTNVTPQMCHDGAIVIADFPVLLYHDIGQLIQVILKYCWQRAHGRRDIARNPRPTFIVADESHLLAVGADQVFQTTARGNRTAVVYATQSISNYLEVFGDRSEPRVHSLLGNLQTQIFHQQTDIRTIAYVQELIGHSRQMSVNGSSGGGDGLASLLGMGSGSISCGFSESFEYELQASDLNSLAKGGPPDWEVEAILYQGGRRFGVNGRTWLPVRFAQRLA